MKELTPVSPCREDIVLPLWRSLHSLNLMLAKDERKAMLLRLFNDDTPLKDRSKERFAATAAKRKDDTNTSHSKSTSTLRGTTAERAKVHYHTTEELADEFPEEKEEDEEEGSIGENEKGGEVEVEVERKKIEEQNDVEGVEGETVEEKENGEGELNVGGGEGIMRIGGRD